MISESELVCLIGSLDSEALRRWIDLGWVLPHHKDESMHFDESDVVRVHLISELHYDLRIDEDCMSVVLSLVDQLYATRRALGALKAAVGSQPEDVRARIAAKIGDCG